jgi:hypothetical protein
MTVRFLQRWPDGPGTTPSPSDPSTASNGYWFQIALGSGNLIQYSLKSSQNTQASPPAIPSLAPGYGVPVNNGGYPHAAWRFGTYYIANSPTTRQINAGGKIKAAGLQPYYNRDMIGTVGWYSAGADTSQETNRNNIMFTSFSNKTSIMVGSAGPSYPGLANSHKMGSPTHIYFARGNLWPSSNNFSNAYWKMSKSNMVHVTGNPTTTSYPTKYILQPVGTVPATRQGTPWSDDTNARLTIWGLSFWMTAPYTSDVNFASGGNHGTYAAPGDYQWNHGQAVSSKTYAKVFTGGGPLHKYFPTVNNSYREQTIQFPYAAFPYGSSYSIPQADMGQSLVNNTGYGSSNRGGNNAGAHAAVSGAGAGYVWGGYSGNTSAPNTVAAVINKVRIYPHATVDGEATTLGDTKYSGRYGGNVSSGSDTNQGMFHVAYASGTAPNTYPLGPSVPAPANTFVFPFSSFVSVSEFTAYQPSIPSWPTRIPIGSFTDTWGHANS